jgi:hypothetical protein
MSIYQQAVRKDRNYIQLRRHIKTSMGLGKGSEIAQLLNDIGCRFSYK